MKTKLFLTGLALMAVTVFANAQGPTNGKCQGNGGCKGTASCSAYVDANNDGVCDNAKNGSCNATSNNGTGTGSGNVNGSGQGKGQGGNCATVPTKTVPTPQITTTQKICPTPIPICK